MTKITAIQTIRTRASGHWVFVKALTAPPGLYGIGSTGDHYHPTTVFTAIETIAVSHTTAPHGVASHSPTAATSSITAN